jgi:AsmA protein
MRRLIKILAWLVGGLALLAVGLAILITLVVDPNSYKPEIAALVEKQTGRRLSIQGDLELTFFPRLGVRAQGVALSNPPGFGDSDMLTVAQVEVRASLMPLLSRRFEADTIVVKEPAVHLIVESDGTTNWQDLTQPSEPEAREPRPAGAMAALAIQGIDLEKGRLIWEDRQAGARYVVDNIELDVGEVLSQRPAALSLGLTVDSEALEQQVDLKVESQITLDLDSETLVLSDARLTSGYGPVVSAQARIGSVRYELNAMRIEVSQADVDIRYTGPQIDGTVTSVLKTDVTADIGAQKIAAPGFYVEVDGLPLEGDVELSNFLGDAVYRGSVRSEDFRPADLLRKLDVDYRPTDPEALGSAALSVNFEGTTDSVRLQDLKIRLDETNVDGFVDVESFDPPGYRFEINIDEIDVDRYAPADDGAASEAGAAMVVLPVGLLRGLTANGRARIGSARASGIRATDVEIGVASSDQGLSVKPISAALYGGTLQGEMRFIEKEGAARLRIEQVMNQVQMSGLLTDAGVTDRVSGKGRLELDVVALELNGEPKTKGIARFHFFDGAIKGLNLRKLYLQARRIYNERKGREEAVEMDDRDEFSFTELKGTLEFDERTARNDDLDVKSPLFRINGRGQADLAANRLDYLLLANVVESAKGQGGEELTELKGVTIPIRIRGPLDAPVYALDVEAILKLALKQQVEKEVEKKLGEKLDEKLGEDMKEQLGDQLQKLFKVN